MYVIHIWLYIVKMTDIKYTEMLTMIISERWNLGDYFYSVYFSVFSTMNKHYIYNHKNNVILFMEVHLFVFCS